MIRQPNGRGACPPRPVLPLLFSFNLALYTISCTLAPLGIGSASGDTLQGTWYRSPVSSRTITIPNLRSMGKIASPTDPSKSVPPAGGRLVEREIAANQSHHEPGSSTG